MYRQIITPENAKLILQLPAEFVGRLVEIIAFPVEEIKKTEDKYSRENALRFFKEHSISLKDYKFNREEANER